MINKINFNDSFVFLFLRKYKNSLKEKMFYWKHVCLFHCFLFKVKTFLNILKEISNEHVKRLKYIIKLNIFQLFYH